MKPNSWLNKVMRLGKFMITRLIGCFIIMLSTFYEGGIIGVIIIASAGALLCFVNWEDIAFWDRRTYWGIEGK